MATISGYQVTAEHNGETYKIDVKEGVRGMNIPVVAELHDNKWNIVLEGRKLTVTSVTKLVPEQS